MMRDSITGKLIVVLTICLTAILAAGMVVDYRISRDEVLQRLRLESQEIINSVVSDLEHWLHGVEGSTLFLARILEQREYSLAGLDKMLRDIVAHNDDIYGATIALNPDIVAEPQGFAPYYYHRNGAIAYANLATGNTYYWQQAWYSNAVDSGRPTWVEPYFDEGGGEVLMTTFSVPVYHINGEGNRSLYAVITADVELEKLRYYLQRLQLGDSGYGVLISRAGVVLSSKNPDAIMQHYLAVISTPANKNTWQRSFDAALRGEAVAFPTACPTIDGQCNIRLSALASTGWPVGIIYSRNELLAPLVEYQIKTALIGLATLLLMAFTVSLVTRRVTRPLVALAEASDVLATGDLHAPLPRVGGRDEVARLVQSFGAMRHDLKSYIDDLEIAAASRARLEGELAAARQIQMSMLPQGGEALERTSTWSLWAKVRPAKSVGGDLYTFYRHGSDRLFISVGDVSDKGVPAALFMARVMSHIQQYANAFESPTQGMALLNNALEQGNDNCMFVTLFFAVLDLQTLELQFASAGHTPPTLLRSGTSTVLPQETGPALGLARDISYPENRFSLHPGDRLAIYTDGIDEAFNADAEMFTSEGLDIALKKSGAENIAVAGEKIFQCVDDFVGAAPQSDDITLMLLDLPVNTAACRSFQGGSTTVSYATEWLRGLFGQRSIDKTIAMELLLVAEEVLTNINKYGQLPTGSLIDVSFEADSDNIVIQFSDQGLAFNPLVDGHRATLGADIESAEIGGLGVHLITRLTDKQSYQRSEGRNLLRVEKSLMIQQRPAPS